MEDHTRQHEDNITILIKEFPYGRVIVEKTYYGLVYDLSNGAIFTNFIPQLALNLSRKKFKRWGDLERYTSLQP